MTRQPSSHVRDAPRQHTVRQSNLVHGIKTVNPREIHLRSATSLIHAADRFNRTYTVQVKEK